MKLHKKKLLAIASLFLCSASLVAHGEPIKVSLSAEPEPPLYFKNSVGKWEGFEVELAQAVCKAAKIDCEIVATAWDGIIPALQSKKIDVIWASMTITPEREKQVSFTIPYYKSPAELIGNKEDQFDFKAGGLKGKKIGVQTSTVGEIFLRNTYPEANIKTYGTIDSATADLSAGRLDLVLSDAVALMDFLKGESGSCCNSKFFAQDPIFEGGIGGGVRKEDIELKAKFDTGIRAVYASGEFAKLQGKYFDYDVGTPPTN